MKILERTKQTEQQLDETVKSHKEGYFHLVSDESKAEYNLLVARLRAEIKEKAEVVKVLAKLNPAQKTAISEKSKNIVAQWKQKKDVAYNPETALYDVQKRVAEYIGENPQYNNEDLVKFIKEIEVDFNEIEADLQEVE